jgi:hypothetical protein
VVDGGKLLPRASDDAAVAALGSLRVVMYDDDRPSEASTTRPPDHAADGAKVTEDPPQPPPGSGTLEERITGARVPVSKQVEAKAKRLNAEGLDLHKRLELDPAIARYREALAAWPGHVYARYNLACAHALKKQATSALDALAVLHGLSDRGGLDMLREARLDEDFASLRALPRFRRLTGYTTVGVVAGLDGSPERVERAVALLRKVHIPARAQDPWDRPVNADTLYVRDGDNGAEDMADEITDALGIPVERLMNARLGPKRPLVLVLTAAAQAPTAEVTTDLAMPEEFVGVPLIREEGGTLERLHLKARRFFTWETRRDDGTRIGRTGTYYFNRGKLHLDFQQTTETPVADGEPEIDVLRGKREHHRISTDGVSLTVGKLTFVRQ